MSETPQLPFLSSLTRSLSSLAKPIWGELKKNVRLINIAQNIPFFPFLLKPSDNFGEIYAHALLGFKKKEGKKNTLYQALRYKKVKEAFELEYSTKKFPKTIEVINEILIKGGKSTLSKGNIQSFVTIFLDMVKKAKNPSAIVRDSNSYSIKISDEILEKWLENFEKIKNKYIDRTFIAHSESADKIYNTIDLVKSYNKIVLLSGAGVGKSTELLYIAWYLNNEGYNIYPINLNNYKTNKISDILKDLGDTDFTKNAFVIDGYDEAPAKLKTDVFAEIQSISEEAKVIVSSRTNFYIVDEQNKSSTLSNFKIFYLNNISSQDVLKYVTNLFSEDIDKIDAFYNELRTKQLGELILIPFYLIRLSVYFQKNNILPKNKSVLFSEIVEDKIGKDIFRYNPTYDAQEILKKEQKLSLEKMAFMLNLLEKNYLTDTEIADILLEKEIPLIKKSSLIIKDNIEEVSYKFIHNNFQEYLSSVFLSKQNIEKIKEIITFNQENSVVKPSWLNTLSFLIFSLNDDKCHSFLEWLTNTQPDILVKIEPDKISEKLKITLLQNIFERLYREPTWLNWNNYNIPTLSKFVQCKENLEFLTKILQDNTKFKYYIHKINALRILEYFDKEFVNMYDITELKNAIENYIYSEQREKDNGLNTYIELFDLSDEELDKFFTTFSQEADERIKSVAYSAIYTQGKQDKYVDILLEDYIKYERGSENMNIEMSIQNCLYKLENEDSIVRVMEFFNEEMRIYEILSDDVVKYIFPIIYEKYPNNEKIYKIIFSGLKKESYHHRYNSLYYEYIYKTNKNSRFLIDILAEEKVNYDTFSNIVNTLTEETLNLIIEKFLNSGLDKAFIIELQYFIGRHPENKNYLPYFNKQINKKESIDMPTYIDYKAQEIEKLDRNRKIIFNIGGIYYGLIEFFKKYGNTIDYNAYRNIRKKIRKENDEEFSGTLLGLLSLREDQILEKDKILEDFNKYYKGYGNWFHNTLIHFIKNYGSKNITFEEFEIKIVKDWCDSVVDKLNFDNYTINKQGDSYTIHYEYQEVWFCFYAIYFEFYDYPEKVYLDMLNYYPFEGDKMYDFILESPHISKQIIDNQIVSNLKKGLKDNIVIQSYMRIIEQRNIRAVTPYLITYIKRDDYINYWAFSAYEKLEGDTSILYPILEEVNEDIKFRILDYIFKKEPYKIKDYVESKFDESQDDHEKINYAGYLIALQSTPHFAYFVEYCEKYNRLPQDWDIIFSNMKANYLLQYSNIEGLSLLLYFYELGMQGKIPNNDGFRAQDNYKQVFITILKNIALHNDNFENVKNIIKKYIKEKESEYKDHKEFIPYLYFYIDLAEKEYYINKESNISIEEALEIYENLLKK